MYVLEQFYEAPCDHVAESLRSCIAHPSIIAMDPALLLRALEVYEIDRVDFAKAYLVACMRREHPSDRGRVLRPLSRSRLEIERIEP